MNKYPATRHYTASQEYTIERNDGETKTHFLTRIANEIRTMNCHICEMKIDAKFSKATIVYQNRNGMI